jgi:hypothetical protein
MIRPLNIILARIARREQRIANMRDWGIAQKAIDFEQNVLDDLKRQYIERTNRLRLYMGVA